MKPDDCASTSTDDLSSLTPDELQVVAWYREQTKPSRQQNLTPLRRKERAATLRLLRRAAKGLDGMTLAVSQISKGSRRPLGVSLSNKLTAAQLPKVYGHEIGHVVDQLAGDPTGGTSEGAHCSGG